MKHEEVKLNDLLIVGIAVRTTNKDFKAQKDISELWNNFIANNVLQLINNRLSNDVYCIYTDYENDFTGEYTTILGCLVSDTKMVTGNLISKTIPACKYYRYVSEGKIPECVAATWTHIWNSAIDRKYTADFDIYGTEAADPINAKITTYLSIK